MSREAITYLITSKCPRPELHDTRLLVEGEVRYVDCTRTLKSMKKKKSNLLRRKDTRNFEE